MNKTIIIAEAGVNHNGDVLLAKKLIEEAKNAGADYVKFQTFLTDLNISKKAEKAHYQKINTGDELSQYEMVRALELSFDDFSMLNEYCNEIGIKFLSTGFDIPSLDFLEGLNPDFFKIPSGEITNKSYLQHVANKKRNIVMSTGMANKKDISRALDILINEGISKSRITVLHCNTEYPTPMSDVNLRAMIDIAQEFNVDVGYSDHTLGIEVPIAAVTLGARIIEKHFTLDRNSKGPDHAASLDPKELKAMVDAIRNIEFALAGSGIKELSESEQKNLKIARKSLHLCKDLSAGSILAMSDLIALRPGDGISPMDLELVVGKTLIENQNKGHKISLQDLA